MKFKTSYILALLYLGVILSSMSLAQQNSSEFKTTNPDGRLTIKIQIWGDIKAPGTYYVPDNTKLTDLLGLSGGAKGEIDDLLIRVSRSDKDDTIQNFEFTGPDIFTKSETAKFKFKSDDIFYIRSKSSEEEFLKSINMISAITGVVSSVALLYLFFQQNG